MIIARKIDAVVRNFYANNAAVLSEWTTARHVERGPKRKAAAPEPPPANEPVK